MTQAIDITSLLDLGGKVAIVTGPASGTGRATARHFAATVVCADGNGPGADAIAAELGCQSIPLTVDVSDEASVITLMDRVTAAFGRLDILVNTAARQNRALHRDAGRYSRAGPAPGQPGRRLFTGQSFVAESGFLQG